MTKDDNSNRELVEALLFSRRRQLDDLSKRLGIGLTDSEMSKWARIGMVLAQEQPEFTGSPRGRGKPRGRPWEGFDWRRAALVDYRRTEAGRRDGKLPTTTKVINELINDESPLFRGVDTATLTNSVSRGRRAMKKLTAKVEASERRRAKAAMGPPKNRNAKIK